MRFVSYGYTDPGLRRSNNEDSFVVDNGQGLFIVADGMGGAAAGEIASQIFTSTVQDVFANTPRDSMEDTVDLIYRSFALANEAILKHVEENPSHRGMGCTAEVLALFGKGFAVGHVGDSRVYRFRNGNFTPLTKDHSFVQSQLDQGVITEEEAKNHSMKNLILRAVGIKEKLSLDLIRGDLLPGDIFMLCSDGLTDMVDDEEIARVIEAGEDLPRKVHTLVDMAKREGGYDNITVVLVEIV